MLTPEYIALLDPCESGCEQDGTPCESKEALRWLATKQERYDPSKFIPPLTPRKKAQKAKEFIALTVRVSRKSRLSSASRVSRIEWSDGMTTWAASIGESMANSFATSLLTAEYSARLLITTGRDRCVLDILLESLGPGLLASGYKLHPCISGSRISFIRITKGKRAWTLCYAETMSGVPVSTLLRYAQDVGALSGQWRRGDVQSLYSALDAYQSFLMANFGVAIAPTVGISAMSCVRGCLPDGFTKWRPTPLLVAMERHGKGYRGGLTYARRYRGKTWRLDVNRQYTSALTTTLPYRSAFGRYISPEATPHGVFVCHLQVSNTLPYPVGVWEGPTTGFVLRYAGRGSYVCVLHTSEFEGLKSAGCLVSPYYGYVFTHTFTFERYYERLRTLYREQGRDSAIGEFIKPLGNQIYGKLGQNPWRKELLFSQERPENTEWFPYMDDELRVWGMIWERTTRSVTTSQHVEIAGTITGAARSQTTEMWADLLALGVNVYRCHTDSVTIDCDPYTLPEIDGRIGDDIGQWRLESEDANTIILGANAYVDDQGAHIAGVSDPTWQMIERIFDGHVAYVVQEQNVPLRGFSRGQREVRKQYG